jgi:hypothetical protein
MSASVSGGGFHGFFSGHSLILDRPEGTAFVLSDQLFFSSVSSTGFFFMMGVFSCGFWWPFGFGTITS